MMINTESTKSTFVYVSALPLTFCVLALPLTFSPPSASKRIAEKAIARRGVNGKQQKIASIRAKKNKAIAENNKYQSKENRKSK